MWLPDNSVLEIENNPTTKVEIRIIRHGPTIFAPQLHDTCRYQLLRKGERK